MANTPGKPTLTLLADLVDNLRADEEARYNARQSNQPLGPSTGLKTVDEVTDGSIPLGVNVIQGGPGVGKTAWGLQVASDCGFPALYVSIEMMMLELFRRLIARQTNTFLGKLKSGELGGKEAERLALETATKLSRLALMDATRSYAEPDVIQDAAEALCQQTGADKCVIVIDSLHGWAMSAMSVAQMTEYDALNAALQAAFNIADSLKSPVILISHRNRASQDRGGLHASKGTGLVEYISEVVVDIERDVGSEPDASGEVGAELRFSKNRHGQAGVAVRLKWCGRLQSYREADGATLIQHSNAKKNGHKNGVGKNGASKKGADLYNELVAEVIAEANSANGKGN